MTQLFDSEGNEIEAFTKEEHEEALKQEISKKDEELKTINEKLEGLNNKDINFKALREEKEKIENENKELKGKLSEQINGIKSSIEKDKIDNTISVMAAGDEEIAKKIKFHYDRIIKPEDTEEEKKVKLSDALKLALGGTATPNVLNNTMSAAGAGKPVGGKSTFTPDLIDLGNKFGLSEEDIKKYGQAK